jgi:Flp pilus assembly protein TadD
MSEVILGPDHPDTLRIVNNLAGTLASQGNYDAAEPLFRRALEGCERQLGPDHPYTKTVRDNLSGVLKTMGTTEAG